MLDLQEFDQADHLEIEYSKTLTILAYLNLDCVWIRFIMLRQMNYFLHSWEFCHRYTLPTLWSRRWTRRVCSLKVALFRCLQNDWRDGKFWAFRVQTLFFGAGRLFLTCVCSNFINEYRLKPGCIPVLSCSGRWLRPPTGTSWAADTHHLRPGVAAAHQAVARSWAATADFEHLHWNCRFTEVADVDAHSTRPHTSPTVAYPFPPAPALYSSVSAAASEVMAGRAPPDRAVETAIDYD